MVAAEATAPSPPPAEPAAAAQTYDAFISYKRTDIAFARALEKALNAFSPPSGLEGVPARRLRVFRDEGDLTGSAYYTAIDGYLARSARLIVVCSPAARGSTFVDDEIRRFVQHHGPDGLVPVLLAGVPNNEADASQAAEMAFPEALTAALGMPLAVAYRGFDARREKVDRGRFEGSWYTLLANLYGCPRDVIEQRDRVRRRRQRNVLAAIGTAVAVSLAALAAVAYGQKLQADAQRNVALRGLARYLASAADTASARQPQTALLLAVEAARATRDVDGSTTPEAADALRRAMAVAGGEPVGGRGARVRTARFSDDGRRLATLEQDGRFNLWDLQRPLAPAPPLATWPGPGDESARSLAALSRDGRWVVLTDPGDAAAGGPLLWDTTRPIDSAQRLGGRVGEDGSVLGFSPDGRWLATADSQGRVHLTDLQRPGADARQLDGHSAQRASTGQSMGVRTHRFDPTGRWLYTAGWDRTARLWDLQVPDGAGQVLELADIFESADFSRDGRWFAVPLDDGGRRPVAIGLWRHGDNGWQKVEIALPQGEGPALKPAVVGFAQAPTQLVAVYRGKVHLWNLDDATLPYRSLDGRLAVLDSGGTRLAVAGPRGGGAAGERLQIVDPAGRQETSAGYESVPGMVTQLRFDADGDRIGVVAREGSAGTVRFAATRGRETPWVLLRGADTAGDDIRFGADGRWVFATATWGDFTVRAWPIAQTSADPAIVDADARAELSYRSTTGGGGGDPQGGLVHAVALDPKSRWLVTPGPRGSALLIDLRDPSAPVRALGGHDDQFVTAAVFGPEGRWVATAAWKHGARLWRPEAPEQPPVELKLPPGESGSSVSAMAASPDGRWLATGGAGGAVALWRTDAPTQPPRWLAGHEGWITDLAFSADGTQVLSAGEDGKLALWRVADAADRPRWTVEAHRGGVTRARFTGRGPQVVSAGRDALVKLWNTDDAKAPPAVLRGHQQTVVDIAVDTGAARLASGGADGTVRLWDLQQPTSAPVMAGERRSGVSAVALSADGRWLAAADGGGDVRLWRRAAPGEPPQHLPLLTGPPDRRDSAPWGLRFTPDGRWLVAIAGGRVHRWRTETDDLLGLACRAAGRNLANDTWQRHLAGLPYRLTCPDAGLHPAWMSTADDLARKGETARAVALYERALALQPTLALAPARRAAQLGFDAHVKDARSTVRAGDIDAALALYARAQAIDPDRTLDVPAQVQRLQQAQALEREATDQARSGRVEAGIEGFRRALALDPALDIDPVRKARSLAAPRLQRRGDEHAREGRLDEAMVLYRQALDFGIDSRFDPAKRSRALYAEDIVTRADRAGEDGDLDAASRLYAQALALDPDLDFDPQVRARRSVAPHRLSSAWDLLREGRVPEAVDRLRLAQQFDPQIRVDASDLNELCWKGSQRGHARLVMEFCDRAVADSSDGPMAFHARDSRAIARVLTGDRAGAIQDLAAVVQAGDAAAMQPADLGARQRLLARLRAGAKYRTFAELTGLGVRP